MALQTKPFDIAEHLNTPEEIRMFLQEVANEGDEADFIHALNTAAKAMGMTEVAKKAGISRASLYKSCRRQAAAQACREMFPKIVFHKTREHA